MVLIISGRISASRNYIGRVIKASHRQMGFKDYRLESIIHLLDHPQLECKEAVYKVIAAISCSDLYLIFSCSISSGNRMSGGLCFI
jgi:hypothetical protein